MRNKPKPPELAVDGKEMELFENDPLSGSSVKAKLAWDHRDSEYVLVWWQNPFYIATENGGYSMTAELLEQIPDNIEKFWVMDDSCGEVKLFKREWWDDPETRVEIHPESEKFKNVTPDLQYAVDREKEIESHPIYRVDVE